MFFSTSAVKLQREVGTVGRYHSNDLSPSSSGSWRRQLESQESGDLMNWLTHSQPMAGNLMGQPKLYHQPFLQIQQACRLVQWLTLHTNIF